MLSTYGRLIELLNPRSDSRHFSLVYLPIQTSTTICGLGTVCKTPGGPA